MDTNELLREPDDFEKNMYRVEEALALLERCATATGQSLTALAQGFAQALTDDDEAHEDNARTLRALRPLDVSELLIAIHRLLHDMHEQHLRLKEGEAQMQQLALQALKDRAR